MVTIPGACWNKELIVTGMSDKNIFEGELIRKVELYGGRAVNRIVL